MPYKISGTLSEDSRIIVLKESDWSIESNTVSSGSGAYEIEALVSGTKTIIARNFEGEVNGFGDVTPVFYELLTSDFLLSGTPEVFNSGDTDNISSVMIDSTHVLISYKDNGNSGYGTSIIGTIEGTTITWGSESVFNSGDISYNSSVMIDSTHVLVSYNDVDNFNRGTSIVGTIDGTSITWGNKSVFMDGDAEWISSVMLDSTHVVISYRDDSDSNKYGYSIVGTIDGTSITFGSESLFNSGNSWSVSSVMIDSTHVMVSYQDYSNSGYGTSIIGTINGTTITWGSEYVFNNSGATDYISAVLLDSTHVLISYQDYGNSEYGTSIIGTITGTSIAWGSASVFNSGSSDYIHSVMTDATHVLVSYRDHANSYYGTSIVGTIDGTSITWASSVNVFNSGTYTDYISSVILDSTHVLVSYADGGNSYYGTSVVLY